MAPGKSTHATPAIPKVTKEALVSHVEQSIEKALKGESNLDAETLSIKGFSTPTMRHLFSNLCHLPKADPVYCEVGLYAGASFCAAINNNPSLTAIGYEDFSQSFSEPDVKTQLESNIKATKERGSTWVIKKNFFEASLPFGPVDIFFYDGEHSLSLHHPSLHHRLCK